jgi:hypothetical protein
MIGKYSFLPAVLSPLDRAGRVRSNRPPDFARVGDQCALIMKAFRTLIRFSALGHKEEPIWFLSASFVAACGETCQEMPAVGDQAGPRHDPLRECTSLAQLRSDVACWRVRAGTKTVPFESPCLVSWLVFEPAVDRFSVSPSLLPNRDEDR